MTIFTKSQTYKPKKKRKPHPNALKKYKAAFTPLVVAKQQARPDQLIPSAPITGAHSVRIPPQYEGEMLERELAARAELERKKKFVAPMHKSNYIYVGGEAYSDIKGWGRKNEVL